MGEFLTRSASLLVAHKENAVAELIKAFVGLFVLPLLCFISHECRSAETADSDRAPEFRSIAEMLAFAQLPKPIENEQQRKTLTSNQQGILTARIVDREMRPTLAGHAAVFLCDGKTGRPIHRRLKKPYNPLVPTKGEQDEDWLNSLWIAETSPEGACTFDNVPAGEYRIVAQSWSGMQGFPGFGPKVKPSATITLHGFADDLQVKPGHRTNALLLQLGNHTMRITCDPAEPHNFVVLSLKPTLGDGILGPAGWGKEFVRHAIGITQMEVPHLTIHGLPNDTEVSAALLNYDNSMGVGAKTFAAGAQQGIIRILAGWSNGHKDPPDELAPLVSHIQAKNFQLEDLVQIDETSVLSKDYRGSRSVSDLSTAMELLLQDSDKQIVVPEYGECRLADVVAAFGYIDLAKWKR